LSLFSGVTITLTQNSQTVASITTDSSGYAATTINSGYYTLTFSYPDRAPSSFDITINHNNTYLVFAFPYYETLGSQITTAVTFTQVGDIELEDTPEIFSTDISFVNT
jgi:hypothetical protein